MICHEKSAINLDVSLKADIICNPLHEFISIDAIATDSQYYIYIDLETKFL